MPGMVLDAKDRRMNKTYLHGVYILVQREKQKIHDTWKQMEKTINQGKEKKND